MGYRADYKSIISMTARTGFKWSNARVGIGGELHSAETPEVEQESSYYSYGIYFPRRNSYRILTAGPEVAINTERVHIKLDGKWIVNDTSAYLHDMGDVMDRGSGCGGVHAEVKVVF